jgi:DnaJ-class molecular chaperone
MAYVFSVEAECIGYPSHVRYFSSHGCYGAGGSSVEEVMEAAVKSAKIHKSASGERYAFSYSGKYRVIVKNPCSVCKVSGVKPGCKKKKCEACLGEGVFVLGAKQFEIE